MVTCTKVLLPSYVALSLHYLVLQVWAVLTGPARARHEMEDT
jgi:hypothetical protein